MYLWRLSQSAGKYSYDIIFLGHGMLSLRYTSYSCHFENATLPFFFLPKTSFVKKEILGRVAQGKILPNRTVLYHDSYIGISELIKAFQTDSTPKR